MPRQATYSVHVVLTDEFSNPAGANRVAGPFDTMAAAETSMWSHEAKDDRSYIILKSQDGKTSRIR